MVVDGLAFSSDGEALLVFSRNAGLKVLEIATGRERPVAQPRLNLAEGPFPGAMVSEAAFSIGNSFLAVDTGTTIHMADLATGVERFSSPSRGMAFTPDGKGLAVVVPARRDDAGPGRGRVQTSGLEAEAINLVDLESGKARDIELPRDLVVALAFSPDGNILAVAGGLSEPIIRLYRTDDGRELGSFALPAAVNRRGGIAFSPDGRRLAAGLMDTSVPIWDVGGLH